MAISIVATYFLILLLISIYARKAKSIEEYLVGDKKIGTWCTVISVRATGESGWLILGLTGMGYVLGLHAIWIVIGETLFEGLSWIYFARKFKKEADRYNSITVTDYLESKVGDKIGLIRILSTLIIVLLITSYLAAQVVALGKTFYSFFQIDSDVGIIIGMVAVLIYTLIGGYKAVCWTDLVQGVLMILGLMILPVLCFISLLKQGINIFDIASPSENFWNVFGKYGFTVKGIISTISFLAVGLGFLGAPHIYVRFISAKSVENIKKGIPVAIIYTLVGDGCAVLTGILGRYLFPGLVDGELIVPVIAKSLISPVIVGFFVSVVLAAIMSTADSLLMLVSTSVVRDVFQKLLGKDVPHKGLIKYTKMVILAMSLLSVVAAMGDLRLVFWMVLFAWAALGSAFNPLVMMCLLEFKVSKYGAVAGMIGGVLTAILWNLFLSKTTGIYEMIPGFIIAFVLIYMVSKLEPKHENIS